MLQRRLVLAMSLVLSSACRPALDADPGGGRIGEERSRRAPPVARRSPVTDVYHGVAVADDYRWLENWDDPEVQAWSEAQNRYARAWLEGWPEVATLRREVAAIQRLEIPSLPARWRPAAATSPSRTSLPSSRSCWW